MSWTQIYTSYTDEILATLTNPGLVRRALKDLDTHSVTWVEQLSDSGCISIDGQQVNLNAKGIPAAKCTCPSAGICKHIISVSIWLRNNLATVDEDASDKNPVDALADALSLDLPALFKSAGIANVRKAWQLLQDMAQPPQISKLQSGLNIEFMDLTVAYLVGGKLDAMVSAAPEKQARAIHLAALVSVWQLHQKIVEWPKGIVTEVLNPEKILTQDERDIIDQTELIISELLELGLAHISAASAQRLLGFSLSVRAEGLPRLAALLRTLSGLINALAERRQEVDLVDALLQLAQLYAWCESCRHASGKKLEKLRGQYQREFNEKEKCLELLPLGAWWWQNPSGARGLSLALLNLENPAEEKSEKKIAAASEILLAVQARPNNLDSQFTAEQAWARTSLWQGSVSVSTICSKSLILENARLTLDGRIALAGETRAKLNDALPVDDSRLNNLGIRNWQDLSALISAENGLHGNGLECVVLCPVSVTKPQLDEITQTIFIEAIDGQQKIILSLSVMQDQHSIKALEYLLQKYPSPRGILARIIYNNFGYSLEPVSLLVDEKGLLCNKVLMFENYPLEKKVGILEKFLQKLDLRKPVRVQAVPKKINEHLVSNIMPVMESLALTGRLSFTPQQKQTLHEQAKIAQAMGLDIIYQPLINLISKNNAQPIDLLKVTYLLHRLNML
jgi:hypothetical protein